MDLEDNKLPNKENESVSVDLDKLLDERERLDELIKKKFTKTITIMFTDMKGSSSIAESEGDVISRSLIKKHNDILLPVIRDNNGVLVKTMGDGTLSYFDQADDAVRAAVRIQADIETFNHLHPGKTSIQVRIGLNTGTSIVEKDDIFGDGVNVASRFQSIALPGEVYISENTYKSLGDKDSFYCKLIQETKLKGMKGIFKVYKVFWDPAEIERDQLQKASSAADAEESSRTIALEEFSGGAPSGTKESREEAARTLQKAQDLERENELVELYLYYHQTRSNVILDIYRNLESELENAGKIETRFNGEDALWIFKDIITMGRTPDADLPFTNKAISRVPVNIGMKNGEGFLEIRSRGTGEIKPVEIDRAGMKVTMKPDVAYNLGKSGVIIFSVCFPVEYKVYKDRFIILRILNPEECIKKHFNFQLKDVWKNFEAESGRIVVIGK
jgi:class 3 adenylate cyclase